MTMMFHMDDHIFNILINVPDYFASAYYRYFIHISLYTINKIGFMRNTSKIRLWNAIISGYQNRYLFKVKILPVASL